MNNKTLIYSLVSLVAGSTLTGIFLMNKTQAVGENPQILTQTQSQNVQHQMHHPQGSMGMGMGMGMNQEQMDQHFIIMMIPHHQGAVDMANLALNQAKNPELKKLATAIKTAQTKEINEMKDWYKKWYGVDVPALSSNMPMNSGQGMNQGMCMMNMMGMMNMDLTALKNAPNFDQVFVEQMIPHHQMAIMMAPMILTSSHPELRNLAKAIMQTQTAEIEQMQSSQ